MAASVLKFIPPKVLAVVSICLALLAAGWFTRGWYEDGKQKDAIERAIKEANRQHEEDMEIMRDHVEIERVIEVRYEVIERTIPMVVTPECDDLGPDWTRVFNDAVRAAE
jgi:hypothetical protein